jgi:hypothetical protein
MPAPLGSPAGPNLNHKGIEMLLCCSVVLIKDLKTGSLLGVCSPVVLRSTSGPCPNSSVCCTVHRSPKYFLKIKIMKNNSQPERICLKCFITVYI